MARGNGPGVVNGPWFRFLLGNETDLITFQVDEINSVL